ncbi:saccharopine dehydrogenase family protein [Bradyrhizobium sp. 2TAF24]|uniref:saccharopine dehydrogenase family protein n=1 Tax=Bradyrhizobium sp. 2TAF24 TaxID=3233011 RepID=UPI003F92A52C
MTQDNKLVVLGGAGAMGRVAVKTLLGTATFGSIVIADRAFDAARKLAFELGDPRIKAIGLDVTDAGDLHAALEGADVVISTVGPYYRFGTTVLRAAIASRTHYLDICDDWQPTIELLALDDAAKAAGITAIIGAGASPGISNLLAVTAAAELDRVHTLHTVWGTGKRNADGDDVVENSAALHHWLAMLTGQIRVQREGALVDVRPLQRLVIDFPGVGRVPIHTVGHPEPISLPRRFPSLRHSVNAMDMPRGIISVLKSVTRQVEAKRIGFDDAVGYVGKVFARSDTLGLGAALREATRFAWGATVEIATRKKYLPMLSAYAEGTRQGRSVRVGVSMRGEIPGGMAAMTCVPTAVMAEMLMAGEVDRRGAFAPETGVDPDRFFRRLAPFTTMPTPEGSLLRTVREEAA